VGEKLAQESISPSSFSLLHALHGHTHTHTYTHARVTHTHTQHTLALVGEGLSSPSLLSFPISLSLAPSLTTPFSSTLYYKLHCAIQQPLLYSPFLSLSPFSQCPRPNHSILPPSSLSRCPCHLFTHVGTTLLPGKRHRLPCATERRGKGRRRGGRRRRERGGGNRERPTPANVELHRVPTRCTQSCELLRQEMPNALSPSLALLSPSLPLLPPPFSSTLYYKLP